jgi:hypothetical protein
MNDLKYHIDIDSLRDSFPSQIEIPKLLLDVSDWLVGRPWGSIGGFHICGDSIDDGYIEKGNEISKSLAVFAGEEDGSLIALWFYEKFDSSDAPVVFLGEDKGLLANNLEDFFCKIALGERMFSLRNKQIDQRPEFKVWLESALSKQLPNSLEQYTAQITRKHPDFESWLMKKAGR